MNMLRIGLSKPAGGVMSKQLSFWGRLFLGSMFVMSALLLSACETTREVTVTVNLRQTLAEASPKPTGHVVSIKQSSFAPQRVEVKAGESVTWINDDLAMHTVTSWHSYQDEAYMARVDIGQVWDSGNLAAGQSYSRVFDQVGTFEYVSLPLYLYFQYQQNPTGVIVVTAG
jgi:plastocyanin